MSRETNTPADASAVKGEAIYGQPVGDCDRIIGYRETSAQPHPSQQAGTEGPEGMMTLADELNDKADELDMMDARGQVWGLEEWADLMRRAAASLTSEVKG